MITDSQSGHPVHHTGVCIPLRHICVGVHNPVCHSVAADKKKIHRCCWSGWAGGVQCDDAVGHDPVLQGTWNGWALWPGMASGEPWANSLANEHHVMEVQTAWVMDTCLWTFVLGHFPSRWVLLETITYAWGELCTYVGGRNKN